MCMSAVGHHLPPFLIYPRVRMNAALKTGAPEGAEFSCNPSGYMTLELFNVWFDHFLKHTHPSEESPVLLIIDGHSSHTKNLAFTEKARAHHVTVLVLPPHCSNKLQPLDVAFMAPFKTFYADALEKFMRKKPGHVVTQYDIAELLNLAFIKACTTETAVSGFRKTGIVPLNPDIFTDEDFEPSEVTNQVVASEVVVGSEPKCIPDLGTHSEPCTTSETQPSTSNGTGIDYSMKTAEADSKTPDSSFEVSPLCILPLPKMQEPRNTKKKRAAEKTTDITSDEYMNSLKKAKASKEIKGIKQARKPRKLKCPKTLPIEEDTLCDKCGEVFSNSNDGTGWLSCFNCKKWFHSVCFQIGISKCYECS